MTAPFLGDLRKIALDQSGGDADAIITLQLSYTRTLELIDTAEQALKPQTNPAGITDHERRVIDRLAVAWNEFNALHLKEDETKAEFRRAINTAASVIAVRVAQRVNPECWTPTGA